MIDKFEEFNYLWDGSEAGWVLLYVNVKNPEEVPSYLIVNTETRHALLMHDDALSREVKKKMLENGGKVVHSF
jgi:hypothetical protein